VKLYELKYETTMAGVKNNVLILVVVGVIAALASNVYSREFSAIKQFWK